MLTFNELYEQYAPDVYRFAFWLSGNAADADDITSETFVRAWVGTGRKIQTETIKAYLFTIARNLYLKQKQKENRNLALELTLVDEQLNPEKALSVKQELQQVWAVLAKLPEIDRAAFILRVQYEMPYAEISRTLQLSLSAVKVKVHRTRLKLALARMDDEVIEYGNHT